MLPVVEVSLEVIDLDSRHAKELEQLFQTEWRSFRLADAYGENTSLPLPIVAVVDGEVAGGLAYSKFLEPNGKEEVVWVNALFVQERYRGHDIATKLLEFAPTHVPQGAQSLLYAYTHIPRLYENLSWKRVETECEPDHYVLSISLKS